MESNTPPSPGRGTVSVPLTNFYLFPRLPHELRFKIWSIAANNNPRTIDIWTDFTRCEQENTIFYTQVYSIQLSSTRPPAILHATIESRREALKSYSLEFKTTFKLSEDRKVEREAKWYVNWNTDLLVPRGYWNLVSFADFMNKFLGREGRRLAVDVGGVFWRENLERWVASGRWCLEGLEELVVYDTRGLEEWKGSAYLDKFRRKVFKGKRDLEFIELGGEGEEVRASLKEAEGSLSKLWVEERKERVSKVEREDGGVEMGEQEGDDDWIFHGMEKGVNGPKPVIRLCKLIMTVPGALEENAAAPASS